MQESRGGPAVRIDCFEIDLGPNIDAWQQIPDIAAISVLGPALSPGLSCKDRLSQVQLIS